MVFRNQVNKINEAKKYFTFPSLVTSQVVFELARAGVVSEVATKVVGLAGAEVLVFDPVDVGQVVGPGDINLVLVD